jgi:hypothetical protein
VRRFYGAGPLHLLVALAAFALAGWALAQALDVLASPANFVLWLGGAVVAHDLVLFPLYSLVGRVAEAGVGGGQSRVRIAALNHLRVPALLSGLAFLVWFPLILGLDPDVFERTSGTSNDIYLERWLLLTAALFVGSALLFAARARHLRRMLGRGEGD